MACVAFEVAESTKDCDLLCDPETAQQFLELLTETKLGGSSCCYLGNISPPLILEWMIDNGKKHGVKHEREPRGVTL